MIHIRYRAPLGQLQPRGRPIALIPSAALLRFSSFARTYSLQHPGFTVFGVRTEAPPAAILHVLDWITANATSTRPSPLPCPATFEEAVWALQVCAALGVSARLRGEAIIEELIAYIRCAPLTFAEFAMVFEVVPFLMQLKQECVRETERRVADEREGRERVGVPQWMEIRMFCVTEGIEIRERT